MCNCIELANEKLAAANTRVEEGFVVIPIGTGRAQQARMGTVTVIKTMKLDPTKRGAPKALLASHCPFCGVRYDA